MAQEAASYSVSTWETSSEQETPSPVPTPRKPKLQIEWSGGPPEIGPEEIKYLEKIGQGCFGEVYRGRCRGIDVAVKRLKTQQLDEGALEDFRKEVAIMSKLHHPNVVLFMGACTVPGQLAIVTEYLPKGNLAQVLHDPNAKLTLLQRMKMAKQAAQGMTWLHESKPMIIHRDVKPSNFLIDDLLHVKVCDFGLSTVKPKGQGKVYDEAIAGTPLWMAPEVLEGQPLDEKADVYSFGLVLWEIFTRTEPFGHMTSFETFKKAICEHNERPPIPPDCTPSLRSLMERCWHHNPRVRPPFSEIVSLLDVVIADCGIADTFGCRFWKTRFLGREVVDWDAFVPSLLAELRAQPSAATDLNVKCLQAVLAEPSKDPTSNASVVSLEGFGKFCAWFGPLQPPAKSAKPARSLLDKLRGVLQTGWFFGSITQAEADSALAGQPKGTYLVRLSTTEAGSFTVSKVSKSGKINHQRVKYQAGVGYSITVKNSATKTSETVVENVGSLDLFISKVAKKLYLLRACPGSRFLSLFSSRDETEGYLDE